MYFTAVVSPLKNGYKNTQIMGMVHVVNSLQVSENAISLNAIL